jgi:sulfonate transport system permease protein
MIPASGPAASASGGSSAVGGRPDGLSSFADRERRARRDGAQDAAASRGGPRATDPSEGGFAARALARIRPWLSIIALVIVWQACSSAGILDPRTLPGPASLVTTAGEMLADGSLPLALVVSLGRVLAGTAIGVVVGLALGLAAGFSTIARDDVDRPMQAIRTVPFTALTPLLILWFGLGETPKIVLVALAVVVPMYLNTVGGVRGVDRRALLVARAYRLGRWRTVRDVLLPGSAPSILVGLRFATGVAWVAVIVAETVNAASGVGYLLTHARTFGRTDIVMVCIVVYAVLGLLTDLVVRALESRVLRPYKGVS